MVFEINVDSAYGPDGFACHFYQTCWDISREDIVKVLHVFFFRVIVNLSLSLILTWSYYMKKIAFNFFSDLRPISLNN